MIIPLHSFEQYIDETILKRGLSYFEKGYISEFITLSENEYEAIVEGSEEYTVHLKILNDNIVSHDCNCPYDFGSVCKHVVATLFYMQQDVLNLSENKPKKVKIQKKVSMNKQVEDILNSIDETSLHEFIVNYSKQDQKFRNYFLVSFGHLIQKQDASFYRGQIKEVVKAASDRHGFIDWHNMKYLYQSLQPLIQQMKSYVQSNNLRQVFYLSSVLLEEMNETINNADDSNGEIGYFIETSMETLHAITSSDELDPTLGREIFEYCIQIYNEKIFLGWDWHLGILEVAENLVENEQDADRLITALKNTTNEYERNRTQLIGLKLMRQYKAKSEVEQFINQNISNYRIREMEIQKAVGNKNFEYAEKLCLGGIELDKEDKPGLAREWERWLLKIAQMEKDIPKIIHFAKHLYLNDSRSSGDDYFELMKKYTPEEHWNSEVEKLIHHIEKREKNRWYSRELIRKIYIKQEWWDRLFNLLKQTESLQNIEQEESYLKNDYAPELVEMYSKRLVDYVEKYVAREHYKTACRYLRRMKKLGGVLEVNRLIEYFRKTYPMRKALLDELNRV